MGRGRLLSTTLSKRGKASQRSRRGRGCKSSGDTSMSTSADRTYEEQNDSSLNQLYDKVKNLRGVTNDIYSDAESQREGLLADASITFDNFATRLTNTGQRFTRSVVNARGNRLTLYIIGGVVLLFLLFRIFW